MTLAVAAVKPFGRPFKVTDEGGDRSRMMVRWRLAALFGGFSLLSAFSIVWAFVAFLVGFEYPRADLLFPCALDAVLEPGGRSMPVRVAHLSTDRATLEPEVAIPAGAGAPAAGHRSGARRPSARVWCGSTPTSPGAAP